METNNIPVRTWFIDFEVIVLHLSYASRLSELLIK